MEQRGTGKRCPRDREKRGERNRAYRRRGDRGRCARRNDVLEEWFPRRRLREKVRVEKFVRAAFPHHFEADVIFVANRIRDRKHGRLVLQSRHDRL
ncbi:MAG TPA: hypothetical protein VKB93_09380 [Thermoanaerobaculia bacterium]|nr:hypothetical protein [Thermoanaerobaculia bacterium]